MNGIEKFKLKALNKWFRLCNFSMCFFLVINEKFLRKNKRQKSCWWCAWCASDETNKEIVFQNRFEIFSFWKLSEKASKFKHQIIFIQKYLKLYFWVFCKVEIIQSCKFSASFTIQQKCDQKESFLIPQINFLHKFCGTLKPLFFDRWHRSSS